jgi:hypothetical protein
MSTTSPSLERAEYITRASTVKHYLQGKPRFFMFFDLCLRFVIKQNIENSINFIKFDFNEILLSNGVHSRAPYTAFMAECLPRFPPDSQNQSKGLAAGTESAHIHPRKTGGHIIRQSGQGREAATVTKFDMGRSVFHLPFIYIVPPHRNKPVDGLYDI